MCRILLPILLLAGGILQGCQEEVYQWRGDQRDGMFQESDLLDHWPEEGPELFWKYEGLGRGYAAPVVTDEQIFINAEAEGNSYLVSLAGGPVLPHLQR